MESAYNDALLHNRSTLYLRGNCALLPTNNLQLSETHLAFIYQHEKKVRIGSLKDYFLIISANCSMMRNELKLEVVSLVVSYSGGTCEEGKEGGRQKEGK